MLVVDSSVWIGFFNGARRPAIESLAQLLDHGEVQIVVPDLVLYEVLRGFRLERDLRSARQLMESLDVEASVEPSLAVAAAEHYRSLRTHGHTVRGAIDVLVATFCIERDYALLHDDRDFDAFEGLRGLRVWRH
ncbi:MAG TPA: PIN domain nuclease [Rubrivivax sp.]|nr:PIN domain nuclease [Rubrivivax sp.]